MEKDQIIQLYSLNRIEWQICINLLPYCKAQPNPKLSWAQGSQNVLYVLYVL